VKNFFAIFVGCFIVSLVVVFLVSSFWDFLYSNGWALIALIALFLSIIVSIVVKLNIRVEELEEKLKTIQEINAEKA